ncbi:EamA family transporter [Endozoicomonas sp. OPT23]|uniref:DMT family transporter n=1 Tax=Endozoicomonas sp. OPT23 TaxID=2072845 RepID=UPI00129A576B|nr:DMT family transporter [Endozoicomonas sp. OPT23]MRI32005.1 EamA family transporter [Endozoicomonas sp. OPT23]
MSQQAKVTFLFVTVCLIWGTTWLAMELAVATIPPITATGLRFAIAAPLIMLLAKHQKAPIFFPKGKGMECGLISLFYFAIPFTLMIFGEQYISSGLAAIIFANMPVAVLVISLIFKKQRVSIRQLSGLVLALISLVTIICNEMAVSAADGFSGIVALVVAVLMHAVIYTNVQARCEGIHVLTYNALPCLLASLFLLVAGIFLESDTTLHFSGLSLAAVFYLGSVAGIGGIMAYFQLNKLASPFQASICFLIFPVVALFLDCQVNGRSLSQESLFLTLVLMVGVLMTKLPKGFIRHYWPKRGSIPIKRKA